MMCAGCSSVESDVHIQELCLESIVTYGDAVECAVKLDEVQN